MKDPGPFDSSTHHATTLALKERYQIQLLIPTRFIAKLGAKPARLAEIGGGRRAHHHYLRFFFFFNEYCKFPISILPRGRTHVRVPRLSHDSSLSTLPSFGQAPRSLPTPFPPPSASAAAGASRPLPSDGRPGPPHHLRAQPAPEPARCRLLPGGVTPPGLRAPFPPPGGSTATPAPGRPRPPRLPWWAPHRQVEKPGPAAPWPGGGPQGGNGRGSGVPGSRGLSWRRRRRPSRRRCRRPGRNR